MKQFFYIGLVAVLLATACHPDARNNRYDDWDANQNNSIDDQEFEEAFTTSPYYDRWNDDDNRTVTRSEFARSFFRRMDKNNNGSLSIQEWQYGKRAYISQLMLDKEAELDGLDRNNDRQIQSVEFRRMLNKVDYYDQWDSDGSGELDESEVAKGVFTMWDTDDDGVIESAEYELWDNEP